MNLVLQITILRILLIPVFIGLVIYYGESVREGAANESLRHWAAAVFGIASVSDGLDGWIVALDDHGDIAGLASSLGGTLQMLAGGAMVAATGPFFDGTATPMLGAIALCGLVAIADGRAATVQVTNLNDSGVGRCERRSVASPSTRTIRSRSPADSVC